MSILVSICAVCNMCLAGPSALRKRVANLFLQFAETPEFNPEAARVAVAPPEFVKRPQVAPIV